MVSGSLPDRSCSGQQPHFTGIVCIHDVYLRCGSFSHTTHDIHNYTSMAGKGLRPPLNMQMDSISAKVFV